YHVLAEPILPDQEYDRLYRELLELEERHPQLVRPDSPTQRVGEPVEAGLASVVHAIPLLSLDNIFNVEELPKWEQRLRRQLSVADQPLAYACELKVDGVALALRYEDGLLVKGATRGDGHRGEEITASVRTIRSIPLRLRCADPPAWAEVRGEAFLAAATFSAINQQRRQQDEVPFANARNACAGTLRQLDPQVVASRKVDFLAYGLHLSPEQPQPRQQLAALDWLRAAGFKIDAQAQRCDHLVGVQQFYQHWNLQRHHLPYGTDGVVVKLNDLALQQQAGHTQRAPRWAVAMKFSQTEARTTLRKLVAQVGRTGVITPVAEFDPVELEGSTVARATLNNADRIAVLTKGVGLHVGDTLVVRKAGGVIPEVVSVEPCSHPGEPLAFPRHCPECGSLLVRESKESKGLEAATRCVNRGCPAILRCALRHWASRDALDIDGLGRERIEQLAERGLVHTIDDLYRLQEADLTALEGWASPSARSVLQSLESSRQQPWHRVLYGLGIPHVGTANAKVLAQAFPSAEQLAEAFSSDRKFIVDHLEGIGLKTAIALQKWLAEPGNRRLLTQLEASKQPWDHALSDLPVLPLGSAKARKLARAFPSAQQLVEAFTSDQKFRIDPLQGISLKTAIALQKWLAEPGNRRLLTQLEASKQPWDHALSDLPVLPLGSAKARKLARAFPSAQQLARKFPSDMKFIIADLEGIDSEIASSLQKWLAHPGNQKLLAGLSQAGLRLHGESSGSGPGPLTGQVLVLSGTLPSLSRAAARKRIEAAGGTVSGSVSKKTTHLVVGANPSSKLDKARALGIEILDEEALLQRLDCQQKDLTPPGRDLDHLPLLKNTSQDSTCQAQGP
ncbi:MAG: NAD-dependent DNA ligase LigA, partial [Cyanobacteria bacterium MAG IRC1_bin_28]|nr:NAD-dependent DNA ligase LigA [Cyanobacteria bacterium MAG IRC1_bin_28]